MTHPTRPDDDAGDVADRATERVVAFHLRDAEETVRLGAALGDLLRSTESHPRALCVLLSGELGAGKTTLARGLAEGLGADASAVASPTFTIRMDHRGETRPLAHLDAWRLEPGCAGDELASIGFDELLAGDAIVLVEWPERLGDAIPTRRIVVSLEHADPIEGSADDERGDPTRIATLDLGRLDPRESRRISEGLGILVRSPRLAPPRCPTCGRTLAASGEVAGEKPPAAHDPFCSARCRTLDLGDWLSMRHRIAGAETPDLDDGMV